MNRAEAQAQALNRRRQAVDLAADALRNEIERQDTRGFRAWPALIEAIVDAADVLDLRRP